MEHHQAWPDAVGDRVSPRRRPAAAFTLIELMVVVAIIALLIGILLPSFASVRRQAKVTAARAFLATLETANEAFRGEQAIGGGYVPSQTDAESDSNSTIFSEMMNPLGPTTGAPQQFDPVMGASLLVYGLAGVDLLGASGFRDLDNDGYWWNDQHNIARESNPANVDGTYALDPTTLEPRRPRYGPYVGEDALERIVTLQRLWDDDVILELDSTVQVQDNTPTPWASQKVFVDPWNQPILYYRARRGATQMVNRAGVSVGVYDHRDNHLLTGRDQPRRLGADFGPGTVDAAGNFHEIAVVRNDVTPDPATHNLNNAIFDKTFARFIWDRDVTQRNVPVNRETYLLISAGPDAVYGTSDDVVNWTRRQ